MTRFFIRLLAASVDKVANEMADFACGAGIQVIAQGNKFIPFFLADTNNQLTVFFGFFLVFVWHQEYQPSSCIDKKYTCI